MTEVVHAASPPRCPATPTLHRTILNFIDIRVQSMCALVCSNWCLCVEGHQATLEAVDLHRHANLVTDDAVVGIARRYRARADDAVIGIWNEQVVILGATRCAPSTCTDARC